MIIWSLAPFVLNPAMLDSIFRYISKVQDNKRRSTRHKSSIQLISCVLIYRGAMYEITKIQILKKGVWEDATPNQRSPPWSLYRPIIFLGILTPTILTS